MRVLHVVKRFPPTTGGDATVVAGLAEAQRAAGHDVIVMTSRFSDALLPAQVLTYGLPMRSPSLDRISARRLASLAMLSVAAGRLLRRVRPDVVHTHAVDLGFAVAHAARRLRIPVLHTCHSLTLGSPLFSPGRQRLEGALLRGGRYRHVTTVDPTAVERLRSLGLRSVSHVPNGLPRRPAPDCTRPADGVVRALYVGRLDLAKGVDDLLAALARLQPVLPELCCDLVGDGPHQALLRKQVDQLGLADRVRFLGRQPTERIPGLYDGADLVVLPTRHDALPMVLLESWASARPIVISAVGAVPSVCRDGEDALLVPSGDVPALAAGIERLSRDPQLRHRLGRAGHQRVSTEFSLEHAVDLFDRLYRGLLSAGGQR